MLINDKDFYNVQNAFRVAIATTGAYIIAIAMQLEHINWVLYAVFSVMEARIVATLQKSLARFIGTCAGVLCSILLGYLVLQLDIPNIIIISVLVFFAGYYLHNYTIFISIITIIFIFIFSQNDSTTFTASMIRLIDTFIGIGVGIIFSFLIPINKPLEDFREKVNLYLIHVHNFYRANIDNIYHNQQLDHNSLSEGPNKAAFIELENLYYETLDCLNAIRNEGWIKAKKNKTMYWDKINQILELLHDTICVSVYIPPITIIDNKSKFCQELATIDRMISDNFTKLIAFFSVHIEAPNFIISHELDAKIDQLKQEILAVSTDFIVINPYLPILIHLENLKNILNNQQELLNHNPCK